ncbi:MAG: alpha/beta hydrolase [Cyanobacteria bacterium J06614_10]
MFQRFTRRFNPAWRAARLQVSGLGLSLAIALFTPLSVQAAERIRLTYGPFQFSITQADLETYAETGVAEGDLKTVLSRLGPGARAQFQTALNASYDLDPVLANRFSYTSSGVQLLTEIGELVRTDSGRNGFKSLRAALTLAAADPEGLSLITFLEHLPTDMKVDVGQMLSLVSNLGGVLGANPAGRTAARSRDRCDRCHRTPGRFFHPAQPAFARRLRFYRSHSYSGGC